MGVSYSYANLDRQEYFGIWKLGGGSSVRSLGRNLEARALGLLLRAPAPADVSQIGPGAWVGHRIAAVGDSDAPCSEIGLPGDQGLSAYEYLQQHFRDISSSVLRMMIADAPDDLLDAAERSEHLRLALGDLAEIYRCTEAADILMARFGPGWQAGYAKARRTHPNVAPAP